MIVNMKLAVILFDTGSVLSAQVVLAPMTIGYMIELTIKHESADEVVVLQTDRGEPRRFNSLDTVANTMMKIGVNSFHVQL